MSHTPQLKVAEELEWTESYAELMKIVFHTSLTSEGKSLSTIRKTLSRLLLLLALLLWRHGQHIKYSKCQVSDSCTQCQY